MRNVGWRAAMAATLMAAVAGCTGMRSEISKERSLLVADRAYAQQSLDEGAPAAFRAMMAPEGSILARPQGEFLGAELAARAFTTNASPDADVIYWDPDRVWISADDTMGVTSGRFVRTLNGENTEQGRYVTVWRRDQDGAWKADLSMANNDTPAPPRASEPSRKR